MNKVNNLFSHGRNIGDVFDVFQKPLLLWGLEEGWIPKASCMDLPMSARRSLDNDCVAEIMSPRTTAGACL